LGAPTSPDAARCREPASDETEGAKLRQD
jgi:hypothetical protein